MNAPGRGRRVATPLLLLAITLLGWGLRSYAIGRKGLWLDEAFSVWLGWQRLPEMWGWIARLDQHPPLYYTLLNLWMRLGDDASSVRLLSAVVGTLTIPVIFLLGRRLTGPGTGLLAALLLAISPFHVRFAQEARMYTLLAFTAAAAMACLGYLLGEKQSRPPVGRAIASSHKPLLAGRLGMSLRALSGKAISLLGARNEIACLRTPLLLMNSRHEDCFAGRLPLSRVVDRPARNDDGGGFLTGRMPPTRDRELAMTQSDEADPIMPVPTSELVASSTRGRHDRLVWIGYVIFTAAAMLTHSAALLLPVATNLFVFGLMRRRRKAPLAPQIWGKGSVPEAKLPTAPQSWGKVSAAEFVPPPLRRWLLAQAGVLLLWGALWLPAFIGQAGAVYREFWMPAPTWRTLVDVLGNFLSAHLPRQQMPWLDVIWVLYAALLALGIFTLRRRPAVLALLLTLFLTPLVGELLVSLRRPIFYDRTLIWATIPLYVLLAAGIAGPRRWSYILAVTAILVAANGVSLREYYGNFRKEGWKEAAAYVSQQEREGDLILFNASWAQIPFDFYFRAAREPVAEHGLPADLFERGILEPKMAPEDLPRLGDLIRDKARVWLVYSHDWYTDPQGLIPEALSRALTPVERRAYDGLEIRLYEGALGN
jgi:hypothetical protein